MVPEDLNEGFEIGFLRRTPAAPTTEPVPGADGIATPARNRTHAQDPHIQYAGIYQLLAFHTHRILGKLGFETQDKVPHQPLKFRLGNGASG